MKRARALAVCVAVGAMTFMAPAPARAEPNFTYSDSIHDDLGGVGASDIVSVSYDVRTVAPGRERQLVIRMALRQPPSDALDYQTVARMKGCGHLNTAYGPPAVFTVTPGTSRSNIYAQWCRPSNGGTQVATLKIPTPPQVAGRVITWSMPFDDLPAAIRRGTLVQFFAFTQFAEPIYGHIGNGGHSPAPNDWAEAWGQWSPE